MQTGIAEIVAALPSDGVRHTYYHELDDTYYSIGSETFLGSMYSILGMDSTPMRPVADTRSCLRSSSLPPIPTHLPR